MYPITAVILTYNEEPNIARSLEALMWCDRIVIVDSGSTDGTRQRALAFPRVSWFTRPFDTHAAQWTFALFETGIQTDLALALDSDMIVPRQFVEELKDNFDLKYAGGIINFQYCSLGNVLKGSLYPPQLRLLRLCDASVMQRGHTQEFHVTGPVYRFRAACIHDDRKPIERWLSAQIKYSDLELERIRSAEDAGMKDWLRKIGLMPLIAGALAYVRAGGPFFGRAALNYGYERMAYEAMLALRLLRSGCSWEPSSSTVSKRLGR